MTDNRVQRFDCQADFVIRIPSLRLDAYLRSLKDSEALQHAASEEWVRAAIRVASPHFADEIERVQPVRNDRETFRFRASLLRYLSRMSARATPFGLFAGIAIANFGKSSKLEVDHIDTWCATINLDYDWLKSHQSKTSDDKLLVWNHENIQRGGRYFSNLRIGSEDHRLASPSSVRVNRLVTSIARAALLPIPMSRLAHEVANQLRAPRAKVDESISRLIDGGFLLADVEAHISDREPAFNLTLDPSFLHEAEALIASLRDRGFASATKASSDSIKSTTRALQELGSSTKDPLDVALLAKTSGTLSETIKIDLAKLGEFAWRFSRRVELLDFRERFLERYESADRIVPLTELVDHNYGIGHPMAPTEPTSEALFGSTLSVLADNACAARAREIDISSFPDREIFGLESLTADMPDSFELAVQILANGMSDLDKGQYHIAFAPLIGSHVARASWQRFHTYMPVPPVPNRAESSEHIVSDLTFVPAFTRGWNLARRPLSDATEVAIGAIATSAQERLPISDIGVTMRDGHFELLSLSGNRPITMRLPNMINMAIAPELARSVWLLSVDGKRQLEPFNWGKLRARFFLPRLRYQRLIISRARWRFPKAMLSSSISACRETLLWWLEHYDVPQLINVGVGDRLLLLDTRVDSFAEHLFEEARRERQSTVTITESLLDDNPLLINGHNAEFVFSLQNITPKAANESVRPLLTQTPDERRDFPPGSEWCYVRVYGGFFVGNALLLELVTRHLLPALSGMVDKWFFVRYNVPSPHVRVRFHVTNRAATTDALVALSQLLMQLHDSNIVDRYELCTYERELERYASKALSIEDIETLFHFDSLCVIDDLRKTDGEVDSTFFLAIDGLFDMFAFLQTSSYRAISESRQTFSLDDRARSLVRKLVAKRRADGNYRAADSPILRELPKLREPRSATTDIEARVVGSLIHMHFNRWGLYNHAESYASAIFRAARLSLDASRGTP